MPANDTNIKELLFSRHAYLLVGDRKYWKKVLEKELKNFLKLDNLALSPDIWCQSYESFGIKDAHNLIERQSQTGLGSAGRFFILEISSITLEAQNSLLKTFEEPASSAHFFIIARTAEMFLPTLRSRLVILHHIDFDSKGSPWKDGQAEKFLKLDLPDRLDFIQKEFLKSKDKPKSVIIDFVIELEKAFRSKINLHQITKDEELALYELEKCQHYLQNPRSSSRLILEHLALILPLTSPPARP